MKKMYLRKVVFLFYCLLFAGLANLSAQMSTTTLYGTVTDSTGASIPHAMVTIIQTETNYTRAIESNDQGDYRADFLPVGPYKLRVEAKGFKPLLRTGVVLNVAEQAKLDLALEVGSAASENVIVTSDLPLLNTTSGAVSRTVDNKEIDNLPLVNRDVYQLLTLTPGVQSSTSANNLGFPEQHTIINGSTDSTVGQVNYFLDGGVNMTGLRNTGNSIPNPDAIREFVVHTNNFNALYGRTSSGVVSVLTKSGSNEFHGSVFEFVRNTLFNATTSLATTKPAYHRNQFGATLGGPIRKDKTFFFGSYGGLRQVTPKQFSGAVVPSPLERGGDFSKSAVKPIDPTTGKVYVDGEVVGKIPYNLLDKTALNILDRNIPGSTLSGNGWSGAVSVPYDSDEFLIKGDHQLTNSHRLTATYFQTNGNTRSIPGGNLPWSVQQFSWRQHNANLSDVWTVSSSAVNQLWLNYTRIMGARVNTPQISLSDYGSTFTPQGPAALPQIQVTGYFTLAQNIAGPVAGTNFYGIRDVFSWTKGKHSISFGAEGSLEKDAQNTLLNNYGIFQFTGSGANSSKNALADFLLGVPAQMNQDAPVYANANYWNYGVFLQDDYRVIPNLMLNLGIRYDISTPPTDTLDRQSTFRAGAASKVVPNAIAGQLFPGDEGLPRTIVDTRINHISPRVGLVWDPYGNGKTSVRAGAGLFFGTISGNEWELMTNAQPFDVRASYTNVTSLTNVYKNFPGGVSPYPYVYSPSNPRYISGADLIAFPRNYNWPYNYQWNLGIQQQVTSTFAFGLSYIGTSVHNLPVEYDINYPIYNTDSPSSNTTKNVDNRRPMKAGQPSAPTTNLLSRLYMVTASQTSSYNGLQVTFEKRFSHGFSFNGHYTWSRAFQSDEMDNNSLASGFEDYLHPELDRQRSDYDQRHTSSTSIVWQPKYFTPQNSAFLRKAFNDWTLTAIVTLQSGTPFNISVGQDVNQDKNNNDRPNLIPGKIARVTGASTGRAHAEQQWFDTSAFCKFTPGATQATSTCLGAGPAGSDGNVRPNLLDAPGARNIDASLFRNFPIYRNTQLQFRTEVKNVFNLTNLGTPNGTFTSTNFGKITGSNGSFPNRQIQLGARLLF